MQVLHLTRTKSNTDADQSSPTHQIFSRSEK